MNVYVQHNIIILWFLFMFLIYEFEFEFKFKHNDKFSSAVLKNWIYPIVVQYILVRAIGIVIDKIRK